MKRLQIIILYLVLAIPVLAYAFNPSQLFSGGVESSCCDTLTFVGDPGATESFECEDGNFCCTEFTVTDPNNIINTYDSTRAAPGLGTHSASRAVTATDQEDNIIQANYGATDGDFTDRFWYWLPDFNDTNGQYFAAWSQTTNVAGTVGVSLRHLHNNTGNGKIEVHGVDLPDDTSVDLTTDAWYLIEVDYNQDAAGTVKIYNASLSLVDTLDYTAGNFSIQYLTFTNIYSAISTSQTHYYDGVQHKSNGGGF